MTHSNNRQRPRKFRMQSHKQNSVHKNEIKYIVIHSSGTRPDIGLTEVDKLRYHYIITPAGKLFHNNEVKATDGTIELAIVGGINKEGHHTDTRTQRQNDTLFNTIVLLNEKFPDADIVAADKVYFSGLPNPGFDLHQWLASYIPDFIMAA